MTGGAGRDLRVVVVGATGNVGTALVRALQASDSVGSIVGVARRLPPVTDAASALDVEWIARDITCDSVDFVGGADVVVSLAWKLQPSRDEPAMRRTNVFGTHRLARAVAAAGVPAFVYASSVGAYSPADKREERAESHPVGGISTSTYSRHKAEVEALLDEVERDHPALRLVRMRTSLVFQRSAASEIHRIFLGRLLPWHLPKALRFVPDMKRLVFQATHADDIADAYVRAIVGDVRGAFNVAAEPVLTPSIIAGAVAGRTVPVPERLVRALAQLSYRLRMQPSEAGWLDMATQSPVMSIERAHTELGWVARHSAIDALVELLDGIGDGAGGDTLPLHDRRSSVDDAKAATGP